MRMLFAFIICFLLFSCNSNQVAKTYNIKFIFNSDLYEFIDWPEVNYKYPNKMIDDSLTNSTICIFDSLHSGIDTITTFSILGRNYSRIINLITDTIVLFDTALFKSIVIGNNDSLEYLSIDNNDTIYIGQKTVYCIGGGKHEKFVITRKANNYYIEYAGYEYQNKPLVTRRIKLASTFEADFKKLISDFNKLIRPANKGVLTLADMSTTYANNYIRKGNVIYKLPRHDLDDWKGFDEFKEKLNLYDNN
jgi:hypothetical protein